MVKNYNNFKKYNYMKIAGYGGVGFSKWFVLG